MERAIELLGSTPEVVAAELPADLPEAGIGASAALDSLAPTVLGGARDFSAPGFFGHMDPPTPWITWVMHLWAASRNQNLLHPDTAPVARHLERQVVDWLSPSFGMTGGHLTPGSSLANLTAIWAARQAGAHTVVATKNSHLSVAKAAHLLGMFYRSVPHWNGTESFDGCVAVITAGTTSTGEIERLDAAQHALWRHVDAAWSGPLVLSEQHRHLLAGIEDADSVAVSAHKWLFQPKESALVLFKDAEAAHQSLSFGAGYLAVPNVGLQGSHGATAIPLLAMLLAYGRSGVARWIDEAMNAAATLGRLVHMKPNLELRTPPQSGIVNWRHNDIAAPDVQRRLPKDIYISTTTIDEEPWLRSVAANPMADAHAVANVVADMHESG